MALSAPEPLSVDHDVSKFSCGKPTLDHWLKTRALANQEKGFTAVMVVHDAGRVVGYYGLAPTGGGPFDLASLNPYGTTAQSYSLSAARAARHRHGLGRAGHWHWLDEACSCALRSSCSFNRRAGTDG